MKTEFKAPELLAASGVMLVMALVNCVQCATEVDWKGVVKAVYTAGVKTRQRLDDTVATLVETVETTKTVIGETVEKTKTTIAQTKETVVSTAIDQKNAMVAYRDHVQRMADPQLLLQQLRSEVVEYIRDIQDQS